MLLRASQTPHTMAARRVTTRRSLPPRLPRYWLSICARCSLPLKST